MVRRRAPTLAALAHGKDAYPATTVYRRRHRRHRHVRSGAGPLLAHVNGRHDRRRRGLSAARQHQRALAVGRPEQAGRTAVLLLRLPQLALPPQGQRPQVQGLLQPRREDGARARARREDRRPGEPAAGARAGRAHVRRARLVDVRLLQDEHQPGEGAAIRRRHHRRRLQPQRARHRRRLGERLRGLRLPQGEV